MTSLKTILMGSAAAISLAAAPALAQEAETAGDAAETQQTTQQTSQAAPTDRAYEETYGESFADWGGQSVETLIGTPVMNDAGENIGEIDNFGLAEDQIVAIVGVGGFLGMGEHSVAVPMQDLSFDGEQVRLSGVTREDLEAMPEYDEGDAQTFAADQTLESGYESAMSGTTGDTGTETAQTQPAEEPQTQQDMAEAETDAGSEMTGDQQMAEGQTAGEQPEGAGQEMAQTAEDTGQPAEATGEQAAEDVAQSGDQTATEAEPMTETAETQAPDDAAQTESEMAQTDEGQPAAEQGEAATEMTATDEGTATAEEGQTEMASTEDDTGWTEEMDSIFADIADQQIVDLVGMEVEGADGEVVGNVDNFALQGEDVVAIVGVGGFLGIGERNVALPLDEMSYDGERLVLSSLTEQQLSEMPEFDESGANYLPEEGTLRGTYNQ